jgi:hypothetical protein
MSTVLVVDNESARFGEITPATVCRNLGPELVS